MKKLLFAMLLCTVAVVSFTSCSKDDDESIPKDKIIGKWEAEQVKIDGEWITIPSYSRYSMSMTFYEDGKYYDRSDFFGTGYGTYKIIGNSIKTYVDGDYMYTYRISSITDTTAEATMIDEESSSDSSLDIRLTKVR